VNATPPTLPKRRCRRSRGEFDVVVKSGSPALAAFDAQIASVYAPMEHALRGSLGPLPPSRSCFRNAARINANSYPSPSIAG
jgi:hypothetical protein